MPGPSGEERVKIRMHLGYLNVQMAFTFVLGVPAAVQTQFTVEGAMDRLLLDAEPEMRRHLRILDKIQDQMVDDLELLAVEGIDEIKIRKDEQAALWDQYEQWRRGLANLFGIAPNPFDQRLKSKGVNVARTH